MLDQSFLDKWVPIIIDESLGPDKHLEAGKPLLSITLYSPEEMEKYKKRFYPDSGERDELRGHVLSMFDFMAYVKEEDCEKFRGRYLMKINSGLSEEAGIFCLLHETAHIHALVNNIEEHHNDPDEWADSRAIKQATKLITDPSLRLKVILEGLTNDFKHR